jgi:excisionase family DNA binding protein
MNFERVSAQDTRMSPVCRTKRISDLLTVEQAATFLDVSVATIWRWRSSGALTGKRVLGRTVFERSEVEAALRKRRQMAAG